jgi:hypothetical protein
LCLGKHADQNFSCTCEYSNLSRRLKSVVYNRLSTCLRLLFAFWTEMSTVRQSCGRPPGHTPAEARQNGSKLMRRVAEHPPLLPLSTAMPHRSQPPGEHCNPGHSAPFQFPRRHRRTTGGMDGWIQRFSSSKASFRLWFPRGRYPIMMELWQISITDSEIRVRNADLNGYTECLLE